MRMKLCRVDLGNKKISELREETSMQGAYSTLRQVETWAAAKFKRTESSIVAFLRCNSHTGREMTSCARVKYCLYTVCAWTSQKWQSKDDILYRICYTLPYGRNIKNDDSFFIIAFLFYFQFHFKIKTCWIFWRLFLFSIHVFCFSFSSHS